VITFAYIPKLIQKEIDIQEERKRYSQNFYK
jgi:hypothetical protein